MVRGFDSIHKETIISSIAFNELWSIHRTDSFTMLRCGGQVCRYHSIRSYVALITELSCISFVLFSSNLFTSARTSNCCQLSYLSWLWHSIRNRRLCDFKNCVWVSNLWFPTCLRDRYVSCVLSFPPITLQFINSRIQICVCKQCCFSCVNRFILALWLWSNRSSSVNWIRLIYQHAFVFFIRSL